MLREQGLYRDSVELTLRKKYFFSDEDVGANDPVQLHLLYTQVGKFYYVLAAVLTYVFCAYTDICKYITKTV